MNGDIFCLEVVQLHFKFFVFHLISLNCLGILKKFVKLWHLSLLFTFSKIFLWWIMHFFQILCSFTSFNFVYLLRAHMKLSGRKWIKCNRRILRKTKVFGTEWQMAVFVLVEGRYCSRADIITRYNFNQV